jgi:hypothetical protein
MTIWNILQPFGILLWPFGTVCGHLVYFSHFGIFGPRKIWQPTAALKLEVKLLRHAQVISCYAFSERGRHKNFVLLFLPSVWPL